MSTPNSVSQSTTTPHYPIQNNNQAYSYKAYGSGDSSMSPADQTWWRQATAALMNHYSDLQKGVDPEQSQYILRPQDLQTLLSWMEGFAMERGIDFDPMEMGGGYGPMGPNGVPMGTEQNAVYRDPDKNVVEADGSVSQIDVWGNNNIINFPPPFKVTAELSTAGEPPSPVIKIIGTDSSQKGPDGQPLKVVVYIHEYEGTNNTVNTWKKTNGQFSFQDNTGGLVKAGEYKATNGAGGASTDSQVNHPVEDRNGTNFVEPRNPNDLINFTPEGPGTWEFSGKYLNINFPYSSDVKVYKGTNGGYVVVGRDNDGNIVRAIVPEGMELNLNANVNRLFFVDGPEGSDNAGPFADPANTGTVKAYSGAAFKPVFGSPTYEGRDGVPAGFENITLNGETNGMGGSDAVVEGDDDFTMQGNKRVWDGKDFNIYAGRGGVNEISANGDVTLHGTSNQQYWLAEYVNGKLVVKVYTDVELKADGTPDFANAKLKETFNIDDSLLEHLKFGEDIDRSRIWFGEGLKKGSGDYSQELDTSVNAAGKIVITGDEVSSAEVPEMIKNLMAAAPGLTQSELLAKVAEFFDIPGEAGGLTMDELKEAIDNKVFPPLVPGGASFWKFLTSIDPGLRNMLRTFYEGNQDTRDMVDTQIRDQVVVLMNALYPGRVVAETGGEYGDDEIRIDNNDFDILNNALNGGKRPWNDPATGTISDADLWKMFGWVDGD